MRHVRFCFCCHNGRRKTRIYQVLLCLLVLVCVSQQRVFHDVLKKTPAWLQIGKRRPPEEQEAMVPTTVPPSLLPVIRGFGFMPEGDSSQAEVGDMLREYLSKNHSLPTSDVESKLSRTFNSKTLSTLNNGRGAPVSNHNSSQWQIPRLVRLGFGSNTVRYQDTLHGPWWKQGNHRTPGMNEVYSDSAGTQSPALLDGSGMGQDLNHFVVLGIGSFIGGLVVILLILLTVFLDRRRRKNRQSCLDVEANLEDSKLSLLGHEVCPHFIDRVEVAPELSSSSCPSTSSGLGDTSSSDNISRSSDSGDVWVCDSQIALSSLSRLTDPGVNPSSISRHTDPGVNPSSSSNLSRHTNPGVNPFSISNLSSRPRRHSEQPVGSGPLVPSLLQQSPGGWAGSRGPGAAPHASREWTEDVTEEGGIITCPGTDVLLVVPPGVVPSERRCPVTLRVHSQTLYPQVRRTPGELVLSSVIEVDTPTMEVFPKNLTLHLPYRAVAFSHHCQPEDSGWHPAGHKGLELRYCDKSTSDHALGWRDAAGRSSAGHYSWPECFSSEPGAQGWDSETGVRRMGSYRLITYKCSDSVCSIQTDQPSMFCLVWRPPPAVSLGSVSPWSLKEAGSVNMCVTAAAQYRLERGESCVTSDTWCGERLEQVTYAIYLADNTASAKQSVTQAIAERHGHQQCGFFPLCVPFGSEVKVQLSDVNDPDWPLEIPFDSTTKTIKWTDICADYGSLTTAEFRCLPKSDDVSAAGAVSLASVFYVEAFPSRTGGCSANGGAVKLIARDTGAGTGCRSTL